MKLIFILSAALMASVSAKPCIRLNSTLIPSPSDPGAKGVSFLEAASESNSTSQQNSVVPVAFGSSSRSSSMPAASSSAPPAAPFSPPGIQQDTPSGGLPTANTSLRTNTSLSTGPSTKGSITCPGGFLNIVFNTDANTEPSLDNRFTTLQKYGANGWIGFTMNAPDGELGKAQLPIVMDPRNVQQAVSALQGGSPPEYLEIFNEPDFSYKGFTPVTDAATAAQAVQPIMKAASSSTTFISPAIAYTASSWLEDFFSACDGCKSKFPVISSHIYDTDPQSAISNVELVHSRHPDKKIWLTELAPASDPSQGCTLDPAGVQAWMTTVVTWAAQSGYVDRVYWNSGEWDSTWSSCNPSLTNEDGSATALLETYSGLCGSSTAGTVPTS